MTFLQYSVDALSLGSTYALGGLGIALLFGLMRLVNFAHGQIIVMGAYAVWFLRADWSQSWPIVVLGVAATVVATALIMERLAFRPLRHASPAILLASSFAVAILVQNLMIVIIGDDFRSVSAPSAFRGSYALGSLRVARVSVFTLIIGVAIMVALAALLKKTPIGIQMLAAAEDFKMAQMLGVRANRVIAMAFAVSGLLAGAMAFIIVSQQGLISIRMGLSPLLIAFVATVLGGIGSLNGAVIGGMLLGIFTTVLQVTLPVFLAPFRDAFLYSAVIGLLLIRPQGLLGTQLREGRT
jgi:branched-chain amino acid transport system permease protein